MLHRWDQGRTTLGSEGKSVLLPPLLTLLNAPWFPQESGQPRRCSATMTVLGGKSYNSHTRRCQVPASPLSQPPLRGKASGSWPDAVQDLLGNPLALLLATHGARATHCPPAAWLGSFRAALAIPASSLGQPGSPQHWPLGLCVALLLTPPGTRGAFSP